MKYTALLFVLMLSGTVMQAQEVILGIDQPQQLMANPGADTLICKTHSVILGAEFVGQGGTGEYYYLWYPNQYLDSGTAAHPVCTPEETTTYMLTVTDENGCTATGFVTVAVDPCLGSNPLTAATELKIYPNPVNEYFELSGLNGLAGEISIQLFNQIGQLKMTEYLQGPFSGQNLRVELPAELEAGFYFIQVDSAEGRVLTSIQIIR